MTAIVPILVALLAGVGLAVQPPTNAALAKASGSLLLASTISFAIGTAVLLTLWLTVDRSAGGVRGVPWWAWVGGLYGAYFVTAAAFAAPRLGLASMLTLIAGSQLVTALLLDNFGAFGMTREPMSIGRVGGVALVIAGIVLVRRG
jgi:transporter family-2 protein